MSLAGKIHDWFEYPHRLIAVRDALGEPAAMILDVGCGNHSPSITKRHFPDCVYHAVDRADWNVDRRDKARTDAYYAVDLERPDGLSAIENDRYDAVVCSHVLEHLTDPYSVVPAIASKVRPGGVFYVEVPSPRSVRLPRAKKGWFGIKGCLNFWDDQTHRTMVDLVRVSEILAERGFEVGPVRRRFLWRRVLCLPGYVLAGIVLRGYIPASVVWDVTGFANCLVARRISVS